jgi:hypothetical protein
MERQSYFVYHMMMTPVIASLAIAAGFARPKDPKAHRFWIGAVFMFTGIVILILLACGVVPEYI